MSESEFTMDRWQELVSRVSGAQVVDDSLFDRLLTAYTEPHRAYHNQRHVSDCLRALDDAVADIVKLDEVELALWFHDVVYDTQATDNEAMSADWARDVLQGLECSTETVERVVANVTATAHQSEPAGPDQKLTVDIDLSILGRPPEDCDQFEAAIRREYDWVPSDVFNATRISILESFLDRDRIYSTEYFANRLERRARENLRRAIETLQLPESQTD